MKRHRYAVSWIMHCEKPIVPHLDFFGKKLLPELWQLDCKVFPVSQHIGPSLFALYGLMKGNAQVFGSAIL